MTEALEIHFMELPKLLIKWRERLVSPCEDALVRWLFLLEGSDDEEIFKTLEEIAMQDPVLNQAMEEWEKSSEDPEVREAYFARRKAILDEKAAPLRNNAHFSFAEIQTGNVLFHPSVQRVKEYIFLVDVISKGLPKKLICNAVNHFSF